MHTLSRRTLIAGLASLASPALAQQTGTIAAGAKPAAAATTASEIIPERGEAAMLHAFSAAAMEEAVTRYANLMSYGGWPMLPDRKLAKGDRADEVILLRQRLIAEAYMPAEALAIAEPHLFDTELEAALRIYQANHGLKPVGRLGTATLASLNVPADVRLATIEANLPRLAKYTEGLNHRYVIVNVPSAQLETVNSGRVYSRHNVVAGKLTRPTPAVAGQISEINFNPYWNAPASIVEKDLIPKLLDDPFALEAMRIRVYDGVGGPEVDPLSVDWTTVAPDRYFFRQEPGGQNAMASVKINFHNKFNVYLHDTPAKELFAQADRYQSSGCIRVEKVHVLVDWILNGQDGFDLGYIEEIAASEERLDIAVRNQPELRIMYLTAWVTSEGHVAFHPDLYQLDHTGFVEGQPEPVGAS